MTSELKLMDIRNEKSRILFLCTGNSCRSQMAEGWARYLKPAVIEAHSAGVRPNRLDPRAVKGMAEVGVDIAGQRAKDVHELMHMEFDYVITLCGHAHETCPVFPGKAKIVHRGFDDPPTLAAGALSDDEAMRHYRRVRDEIREFVEQLPTILQSKDFEVP
jgi:arsenate reductase